MGGSISSLFGVTNDESSEDYLQLTDLGGFLSKYIFIMLDKDKRKLVSKQEYLTLVNHFREQKTTEEELDNFLKRHVPPGQSTEYINEPLFRKLMIQLAMDFDRNVADRMKHLMTLFDKDNDGYVSEVDLCQVYDAIGIQVPIEPIRSLISRYDEDGDNRLSIKEFENLGRSAMSKLFFRKEELRSPVVDALVEDALRKGSASLMNNATDQQSSNIIQTASNSYKPTDEDLQNNNYIPCVDSNNNIVSDNNNSNSGFTIVDNMMFGKPVVLKDLEAASSLFADVNASDSKDQPFGMTSNAFLSKSGDFEESITSMAGELSEMQLED